MATTAFFSVFYPNEKKFHIDFLKSLQEQSSQDFLLYIVNDGVLSLEELVEEYFFGNYEIHCFEGDMFQIREQGLRDILNKGIRYIIFGDSDDFFSKNRVKQSIENLEHYDIVVNDVDLVDEGSVLVKEKYFSSRLGEKCELDSSFIRDKNIFGFTNTAIKSQLLKNLSFESPSKALDWFLFSQILMKQGVKALFSSESSSQYRQYGNNIADIESPSLESIIKALNIKRDHYVGMAKLYPSYISLCRRSCQISDLCLDELFCKRYYIKIMDNYISNPFWWERAVIR